MNERRLTLIQWKQLKPQEKTDEMNEINHMKIHNQNKIPIISPEDATGHGRYE
jgi:hypothetical protein